MNAKLIGAGDIIENSWIIYRRHQKTFFKISLWIFIPTLLPAIADLLTRLLHVRELIASILIFIVSVPAYVAQFLATIVFIFAVNAILENRPVELQKMAEDAFKKFFPALFVVTIVSLSMLGGFLLFVIPGVIFAIWFAFALYESVLKNSRGTEALKNSRALSSGRWWATLWRLAAPTIFWSVVVWLIMYALFLIFGAISQPWKSVISSEPGSIYAGTFLDIVANAVQALAAPLFSIVGVILYKALKISKTEEVKPS